MRLPCTQVRERGVAVAHEPAGIAEQQFAKLLSLESQMSATVSTFEQRGAKLAFQVSKPATWRRLPNIQRFGSLSGAAVLGGDDRPSQIPKLDTLWRVHSTTGAAIALPAAGVAVGTIGCVVITNPWAGWLAFIRF